VTLERRALGATGEDQAAAWYQARGYTVLARNWRCRDGEIDLVLGHGRKVVFCEVKTRTSDAFGVPAEAVSAVKQARIRRLAARWMARHLTAPAHGVRFDVACILGGEIDVLEGVF
jgi:putative endonuclease